MAPFPAQCNPEEFRSTTVLPHGDTSGNHQSNLPGKVAPGITAFCQRRPPSLPIPAVLTSAQRRRPIPGQHGSETNQNTVVRECVDTKGATSVHRTSTRHRQPAIKAEQGRIDSKTPAVNLQRSTRQQNRPKCRGSGTC